MKHSIRQRDEEKSLCLIFLLQRCNNFIGQLWQNYWFRLIKSSELSVLTIGLLAIFSQARAGFFVGSSACRGRLDKSLPQVRETPIYGCFGIGCPAVLVRCTLLYAICLARTTPAGRVDLVADLRVGLLLLSRGSSRAARTTWAVLLYSLAYRMLWMARSAGQPVWVTSFL